MVVIKVEPWGDADNTTPPPTTSQDDAKTANHDMFGFQDLASDYFQVITFLKHTFYYN